MGNLLMRRRELILPSEGENSQYQTVEWIEFTGTQYIDTGYKDEFTIEIDFLNYMGSKSSIQETFFGCQNNGSPWRTTCLRRAGYGDERMQFITFSSQPRVSPFSTYKNMRITAVAVCFVDYQELTINNNTLIAGATTGGAKSGRSLFIGGMNNGGVVDNASYAKMRFYGATIYADRARTQIVRNFVPCVDKDTGEAGLLDTANNVFYGNAGSGSFTYG